MTKQIARVWAFASDTNPDSKHTRLVDMGRADDVCASSHDYAEAARPVPRNLIQVPLFQMPQLGVRKLA